MSFRGRAAMHRDQKKDAKRRGIAFELTLDEWWQIWKESKKFSQRGPKRNDYQMCRFNDRGPYAVGNVYIATNLENVAARVLSPMHSKGSLNNRAKLTETDVQQMRAKANVDVRVLALDFGVAVCTVRRILSRKIWTHI